MQGSTTKQGRIKHWNYKKGYGFIIPNEGGDDVFMHISSFVGDGTPTKGDQVSYVRQHDEQGRPQAINVQPIRSIANSATVPSTRGARKAITSLVLVGLLGLFGLSQYQPLIEGVFGTVNQAQTATTTEQYSPELSNTLQLIQQGGPYPYTQDDTVFQNREGHLPSKPRGYYREYTVDTPGLNHRGPRRVVTGGQPPVVYYYTEDHYNSFVKLKVTP